MIGNWKHAAVASVLCLGLVGAASVGSAQDRTGPGGPAGAGQRPDRGKMFEEMRARHEKMLHDVLSIKPDQEAAFHAYLASMTPDKDGHRGWRGEHAPGALPTAMTTPERLDKMAGRMAERQARFQKTSAATKTFYAALNPEQKRAFDAMPMMIHGGRGHMGGMHGHGGRA